MAQKKKAGLRGATKIGGATKSSGATKNASAKPGRASAVKATLKAKSKPPVAKPPTASALRVTEKPSRKGPPPGAIKALSKTAKPIEAPLVNAKAALKKERAASQQAPASEGKATKSRKFSVDVKPGESVSALLAKWTSLNKKAEQIDAKPYNMRGVFEEKSAITHKVLGWGYILSNRNDRLEVLFKDGIKYLISNYQA